MQESGKQIKPVENVKDFQHSPTVTEFKVVEINMSLNNPSTPVVEGGFLGKTDSLCRKMRKHLENVKTNTKYCDLIEGIDEMTGWLYFNVKSIISYLL